MSSTGQPTECRDRKPFGRRARALATIDVMIGMYCRRHHHDQFPLCPDCARLRAYAARRLERCIFGDDKPNCADCVVHCYRAEMRERIRAVMRWAGPRMLLRHPILAIAHMLAERRPVPQLPPPPRRSAGHSAP
jgi:molybdenum cofactor biosynthesis enzyme MoaA